MHHRANIIHTMLTLSIQGPCHFNLLGTHGWFSATLSPASPSSCKVGIGSLADEVTFELTNGGEDMIAQLSGWRRGIEVFCQTVEVDAAPVQFS